MWRQRPPKKFGAKNHDSGPAPPATIPSPRERPLLARAPSRRIGQPPNPPASLRPTDPAGAPSRLGVRRAPAREARSEPGRVATLTSRSTVTSLRNPVRAHGGAARSTGPRRRGRKSYVELETRPEETRRRRRDRPHRGPSKLNAAVTSFLLLVPSQTSRESLKEGGSATRPAA